MAIHQTLTWLWESVFIKCLRWHGTYAEQIYAKSWPEQPAECRRDGDVTPHPTCQLTGKYLVTLPGLSTVDPFPHMFERCGSMPPAYERVPPQC